MQEDKKSDRCFRSPKFYGKSDVLVKILEHSDHLTENERMSFTSYIDSIVEKQCEKRIEEKSKTLYSSKSTVELPADPQRYVHNFSDLILDKFMLEVSSLGHKLHIEL